MKSKNIFLTIVGAVSFIYLAITLITNAVSFISWFFTFGSYGIGFNASQIVYDILYHIAVIIPIAVLGALFIEVLKHLFKGEELLLEPKKKYLPTIIFTSILMLVLAFIISLTDSSASYIVSWIQFSVLRFLEFGALLLVALTINQKEENDEKQQED